MHIMYLYNCISKFMLIVIISVMHITHNRYKIVVKHFAEPTDAPKFAECFVRCSYYTIMFFTSLYVINSENYWPNTKNCWYNARST